MSPYRRILRIGLSIAVVGCFIAALSRALPYILTAVYSAGSQALRAMGRGYPSNHQTELDVNSTGASLNRKAQILILVVALLHKTKRSGDSRYFLRG